MKWKLSLLLFVRWLAVYNMAKMSSFACEWIVEMVKKIEIANFFVSTENFLVHGFRIFLCVYLDRKGCLPYPQPLILRIF